MTLSPARSEDNLGVGTEAVTGKIGSSVTGDAVGVRDSRPYTTPDRTNGRR
jgi:hypothetical protein